MNKDFVQAWVALDMDGDEIAAMFDENEVAEDAVAFVVERGGGRAIACVSPREGLAFYEANAGTIKTTHIGRLPGGTAVRERTINRESMTRRRALLTDSVRFEHSRLGEPLVVDTTRVPEERVAEIYAALLGLAGLQT
jgi:hypothetical protein